MVGDEERTDTYKPHTNGKCPHCQRRVVFVQPDTSRRDRGAMWTEPDHLYATGEGDGVYAYSSMCPGCHRPVVAALIETREGSKIKLIHPFGVVHTVPNEVPKEIAEDFLEAATVLQISEKASAALSRRCMQHVLMDLGATGEDLNQQVEWFMKNHPSKIADNLDYVRHVGNFAAHPTKSKSTGEIVDVCPEEASWNLEVLEQLFDYCYVQPAKANEAREKLRKKIKEAGKKPERL